MQLSKNFTKEELQCKHCGLDGVSLELVTALQALRDLVGCPIKVTSAFRCPNHPLSIQSPTSQHAKGFAADIRIKGMTVREMYNAALKIPAFKNGGVGVYDQNFIHVDVRDGKARWGRINGVYIGIDEFFNRMT